MKNVNVFGEDVEPESVIGPMAGSKNITLSKCELDFLCKGPKYMMRTKFDEKEFKVEIKKMLVKEGFNEENDSDNEDDGEKCDSKFSEALREIETKSRLVYDKETIELDLGNMKASDFKFNK